MNSDPENVELLKKLLAFKRHEQPPPGYFNELPRKVWARIEADEARPSFWQKLFPDFALKPAVAYAFGVVVCGTLIVGIGSTLQTGEPAAASVPAGELERPEAVQIVPASAGFAQESTPLPGASKSFSTNPVFTSPLFQPYGTSLEIEPASYNPNGTKP